MPVSRTEATPARLPEPTRAEVIAAALEQQRVGRGSDRWVVHVLGVHTDSRHVWVQVAPREDGTHSIVLRLSMWATAHHALATLAALPKPTLGCPPVVPVMCPM
jgi:hypothetical protein